MFYTAPPPDSIGNDEIEVVMERELEALRAVLEGTPSWWSRRLIKWRIRMLRKARAARGR